MTLLMLLYVSLKWGPNRKEGFFYTKARISNQVGVTMWQTLNLGQTLL